MYEGVVREIMTLLQRGYGDNSATSLDRVVATNIANHFLSNGWLSPSEVAILVEAAGGEIIVTEEMLVGDAPILQRWSNPTGDGTTYHFKSIDKTKLTENAKVNPDAESRGH